MATSTNPTVQSSVGGNLEVVQVLEHKRSKEIWDHYDLCLLSNGSKKARCKYCHRFFTPEANSTLKAHTTKACKALDSRSDPSQANITPQCGVLVYDNDALREEFSKFVIRRALPFDHFDDPKFTTIIQQKLQPQKRCYKNGAISKSHYP